jgi:predicted nucleotidyltransferase
MAIATIFANTLVKTTIISYNILGCNNMNYGLTNETYNKIKKIVTKYNNYEFKVFGSRARGDYKPNSDIDIVVKNCTEDKDKFNIKNEFDLLDIPYTIDLIFIEDITKKEFLDSIEREGKKYE